MIDGRNVWRTDLDRALGLLERAAAKLGADRIMVAPSCSLLHCPIDLDNEHLLDAELKGWMAFAKQKLEETTILARALNQGRASVANELAASRTAIESRNQSGRTHNAAVRQRPMAGVGPAMLRRGHPFLEHREAQRHRLPLPSLPTTTIGSFPQTAEVRKARARVEEGRLVVGPVRNLLPGGNCPDGPLPGGDRSRRSGPR